MLKNLFKRPWVEFPPMFFVFSIVWITLAEGLAVALFSEIEPVRMLLMLRSAEILGLFGLIWWFHLAAGVGLQKPGRVAIRVFLLVAGCAGLVFAALLLVFWLLDISILNRLAAPAWIQGLSGLIAMLLLAPVAEELFFRGVVYRLFRQSFGMPVAVVLSAACFAMMHGSLLSPQLAGGLIFAVAYEGSRNLWIPVALHAGANAAVLLIGII